MPETTGKTSSTSSSAGGSREVKAQLYRLLQSSRHRGQFFCYSWDFETNHVVGVSKEEFSQWLNEIPRTRLVRRCECWVTRRVEYNHKNQLSPPQKMVIRLESYGHCKRERMIRSLNPLALAVGKVMVDYVFMFLEDEETSKDGLVSAINRSISAGRLYDAQRKTQMLVQVFGESQEAEEFMTQIGQFLKEKKQEQREITVLVQEELRAAKSNNLKRRNSEAQRDDNCVQVEGLNVIQISTTEDPNSRQNGEQTHDTPDGLSSHETPGNDYQNQQKGNTNDINHANNDSLISEIFPAQLGVYEQSSCWEDQKETEYDQTMWECMIGDTPEVNAIELQS